MGILATESEVRLRTQTEDVNETSTALIDVAIEDANVVASSQLRPEAYAEPVDDAVVLGETLLACGLVLRSLASRAAVRQNRVRVGGQSAERGRSFGELMRAAAAFEAEAWEVLAPYTAVVPGESARAASESAPVLGR